ncbi:MAG TPA: hypothetical protein VEZ90_06890, partial [Blastocatellia bacterium]|nr:hypothetical protein [Blastocatellia bacterium]
FVLFGTAGVEDFNFAEMFNLAETLDSLAVTNRLEIFDGEHGWAPPEVCTEAVEWMEIQAMRLGRRSKDAALIQKLADHGAAIAQRQAADGKTYQAWKTYSAMVSGFSGLADTAAFQAKAAELKDSKSVRYQLKQIKEEIKRQQTLAIRLEQLKYAATVGPASGDSSPNEASTSGSLPNNESALARSEAAADLKRNLKELDKASAGTDQTPEKIVATRVLSGFWVGCLETAEILKSTKKYDLAAANLEFAADARPHSAFVAYNLAQAYALAGNRANALSALEKTLENGWTDVNAIEKEKAFDAIRQDAVFTKLVDRLKQQKSTIKP